MKLADKIIQLRKKIGWSQEELAEKMNVSRQSVSKWESATSIPDMNKILKLSEIFSVSTDYLLKDEIETLELTGTDSDEGFVTASLKEASEYLESKVKISKVIAKATFLFIIAVTPLIGLQGIVEMEQNYISDNIATGIGLVLLLVVIALGVVMVISSSQYKKHFVLFEENDFELEYGAKSIFEERMESFKGSYIRQLSISVSLFIVAAVPLLLSGIFDAPDWVTIFMLVLLLFLIAYGVYKLIPPATEHGVYELLLKRGEFSPSLRNESKIGEKLGAFYWPLVTAIYLGWSFYTMNWGFTWIVWPVAAVLFPALIGLVNLFKE